MVCTEWFRSKPPSITRDDEMLCLGLLASRRPFKSHLSNSPLDTYFRPDTLTSWKESVFAKGYAHVIHVSSHLSSVTGTIAWKSLEIRQFLGLQLLQQDTMFYTYEYNRRHIRFLSMEFSGMILRATSFKQRVTHILNHSHPFPVL
jgi:hypothetical protein